jgi:hypothetical protein
MDGGVLVEARGDLLIVSEAATDFVAIYVKHEELPRLTASTQRARCSFAVS